MSIDSASVSTEGRKPVIYQLLVRLFGNKVTHNKYYGSAEENGCGKFADINAKALSELKDLGISHVWYTGVIEHATMADYSKEGIKVDDPDVVKGRAGSPYAVKDYYDVDPDLAVDVRNRMSEFEALLKRTHASGLKALIDFIPNHVARTYYSDVAPAGTRSFGVDDDKTHAFLPRNDFYYLPGKAFVVPKGVDAGGVSFRNRLKDGAFAELPAKATGNNVFKPNPSIDDWYETIKLNYGIDYFNKERKHFDPLPPVWIKMRDILRFWAAKGVDGFRCDVAEMVPVEFWSWVIPQLKETHPSLIFIAEAYDPKRYKEYLQIGHFDYLYDKVGLYDELKKLIRDQPDASLDNVRAINKRYEGYSEGMLRFLENHDEERIASSSFAGDAWLAKPAMVLAACLSQAPLMIYFGQEVGEPGKAEEGFGKDDGRTTIFDYWGVPEHQKWMNGGKFDGGGLSDAQRKLRAFYGKLLRLSGSSPAIVSGKLLDLDIPSKANAKAYAFIRYTTNAALLMVVNFDRKKTLKTNIRLPLSLLEELGIEGKQMALPDLLNDGGSSFNYSNEQVNINLKPSDALILKLK